MHETYIHPAAGKNSWKRYLSSLLLILLFVIIGGAFYGIGLLLFVAMDGNEQTYFDTGLGMAVGISPFIDFVLLHVMYLFWLLGIFIAIKYIQKRTLRSLITARERVDWRRIWWAFGMFFGIYAILNLADWLIFREGLTLNEETSVPQFLILLVLVLFFTPIQTTVEELFFRGFLVQWLGKGIKSPIIIAIIIALIFGSLHFSNPEMGRSALLVGLEYITAGFMLTFIALKTGSAELSIGAHAANNIFLFLLISDEQSVGGKMPAIFTIGEVQPGISLLWSVILFGVFYWLSVRRFRVR
ncbi:CPBP family intramembrane metalloprotease [Bacillus sp. FJAT-42376]|uniref:CPBP family intramembrane glutamic endopeptidase n=1 Tax=Bacillus sp. FJAT-42376 TaxID=2014076 RepID=UPI000F510E6D|nr:type II CAAX endopeptidase family protein [Bacillus sp. FJAT-42376]AZB44603.1 CPBP family intramembrane metalloprotease [Bacillus sp. FJAT-42376]